MENKKLKKLKIKQKKRALLKYKWFITDSYALNSEEDWSRSFFLKYPSVDFLNFPDGAKTLDPFTEFLAPIRIFLFFFEIFSYFKYFSIKRLLQTNLPFSINLVRYYIEAYYLPWCKHAQYLLHFRSTYLNLKRPNLMSVWNDQILNRWGGGCTVA